MTLGVGPMAHRLMVRRSSATVVSSPLLMFFRRRRCGHRNQIAQPRLNHLSGRPFRCRGWRCNVAGLLIGKGACLRSSAARSSASRPNGGCYDWVAKQGRKARLRRQRRLGSSTPDLIGQTHLSGSKRPRDDAGRSSRRVNSTPITWYLGAEVRGCVVGQGTCWWVFPPPPPP